MASKVYKWGGYWRFCFTDKNKSPRQKWLYFPVGSYKKSDVEKLKRQYEHARKEGRFDPWVDEAPNDTTRANAVFLEDATHKYLEHRKHELSPITLTNYESQLNGLLRDFGNIDLANVELEGIQKHINEIPGFRSRKLRATILNQLFAQNNINKKVQALGTKQEKQKRGTYLTSSEFQAILDQLKIKPSNVRPDKWERSSRTISNIFQILFYMGLRINELLYMRPAWVIDNRFLRIGDKYEWNLKDEFHPKSQRETDNPIAIPREVRGIIQTYTNREPYERIFTYTRQNIIHHLKRNARLAGINKNVYPHMLRDSCISYWLNERQKPIQEVMRLARHESIQTTMIYYHQSDNSHFETFDK